MDAKTDTQSYMEDIVRMSVTDRQVYWHTDTKKTERLCRAGCHRPTDGHVMVGNSADEYDRWADM